MRREAEVQKLKDKLAAAEAQLSSWWAWWTWYGDHAGVHDGCRGLEGTGLCEGDNVDTQEDVQEASGPVCVDLDTEEFAEDLKVGFAINENAELTEKQDVDKQGTADEMDEDAPEFDDEQMRMIVDVAVDGFVTSEFNSSLTRPPMDSRFFNGVADKIKRMYTPGAGQQYSRRQARKLTDLVTAMCARALKQNEGAG